MGPGMPHKPQGMLWVSPPRHGARLQMRTALEWEATCRNLSEETAPGSAPQRRLKGDVKGSEGNWASRALRSWPGM